MKKRKLPPWLMKETVELFIYAIITAGVTWTIIWGIVNY